MSRVGLVLWLAVVMLAAPAWAKTAEELARELSDPKKAERALDELVAKGSDGVRALQGEAVEGKDLAARGWAIAGLGEIGGEQAGKTLLELQDKGAPVIVQSWAASARVMAAPDVTGLVAIADLLQRFPAVDRPFKEKLKALSAKDPKAAEGLLKLSQDWRFQSMIAEPILALGMPRLLDAMLHGSEILVRQQASAYLAVLAQQQGAAANEIVGSAVVKQLAFDAKAKEVPWANGPLFLPGIAWDGPTAMRLTAALVAWDVWCARKELNDERRKITINLNALQGFVGYTPDWQPMGDWLTVWSRKTGRGPGMAILKEQGLENDATWTAKLPKS